MGRIRLQIQVMPWAQGLGPSTSQTRRGEVDKFCQPCDEESTIQELADEVYARWERVNPGIELNIRHLESYFNEPLDMNDKVGDIFDDRKPGLNGQVNETSIVKVLRYPPTPKELQNPQRFASLMPESTARPLKRLPPTFAQNDRFEQDCVGGYDQRRQPNETIGAASKRRRIQNGAYNPDQPILSSEERGDEFFNSSQPPGTQQSTAQINDSQRSPYKHHANPYGTPTSLSLINPHEPIPGDQRDSSEIPDSPNGRINSGALGATVEIDTQSTKSESPELGVSVESVPPTNIGIAPAEHIYIDVPASDPTTNPPLATSTMDLNAVGHDGNYLGASNDCSTPQGIKSMPTPLQTSSKRRHPSVDTMFGESRQKFIGLRRDSDPFDPIESDGESFGQQQLVQNGKRRKLDLGPLQTSASPSALASAEFQRSDGGFLVPPLPKSRSNEARAPMSEIATPLLDGILAQAGEGRDAEDDQLCSQQRPPNQAPETEKERKAPARLWMNCVRSERANVDLRNVRLANGSAEQKYQRTEDDENEQYSVSDEVTKKQQAAEAEAKARQITQKQVAERESEATRLVAESRANQEKARTEKLAEGERARQMKAKEVESAETEAAMEIRANAQEEAQEQTEVQEREKLEKFTREKQAREEALKKHAEKAMQAAEGAKQLKAEKLQAAKSTPSSGRKTGTLATPKTPLTYARNDQQKARRREIDEKRKADKANAAEEEKIREAAKAQKIAQKLAESNAREADESSKATEERQEEAATLDEKTHAKGVLRTLKALSVERGRQSSSPSEPGRVADNHRKSITPAIPKSSIAKSSSAVQDNLLSSSPLAARSSRINDTPLRSALKQSNSALRRSVSFMNETEPTLPAPLPTLTSNGYGTRPMKTLTEINQELIDAKRPSSKPSMQAPIKNRSNTTSSKKPATKAKVQTNLNFIGNKKMKGHAVDLPEPSRLVPEKQTVVSPSEDEDVWSVSSSDEDPNKAGPSSKKSTSRGNSSSVKGAVTSVSAFANIDPALPKIKIEKGTTEIPTTISRSSSRPTSSSQAKSISRSPAHAISEAQSQISNSSSDFESNLESGSTSGSDSNENSSGHTGETKSGNTNHVSNNGIPCAVRVEVSSSPPNSKRGDQVSQQPKVVTNYAGPALVNGSAKIVNQAADKQLKRECRESIPGNAKKVTAPMDGHADKKFPPLDRNGRLPNGTRPAYHRHPKLSELKKLPVPDEPYKTPSQRIDRPATRESEPTSSSDDSSSHSDDNEDVPRKAAVSADGSQESSKPKSGRLFSGVKSLIKVARSLRGAHEM